MNCESVRSPNLSDSACPAALDPSNRRPSDFWAEFGSGKELLVLRRIGEPVISEDEKAISGNVAHRRRVQWGGDALRTVRGLLLKNRRVIFSRQAFTVQFSGDNGTYDSRHGYALNSTTKPKRIDLKDESSLSLGIYELEADRLTLCFALRPRGRARPTDLPPGQIPHWSS